MAKDYFQDIIPPSPRKHYAAHKRATDGDAVNVPIHTDPEPMTRSIRNISAPSRSRSRPIPERPSPARREGRRGLTFIVWVIAVVAVLTLAALLLVALRPTRVSVEPRTHVLTFVGETFTAVPTHLATASDLPYEMETFELEDSELVPSSGVVYAEEKSSGNIIVYNDFQSEPLRLVKNTRFETPAGLIFRSPADITIPGRRAGAPGQVEITVVADQPGEQYNVAAGKFTIPGLRSSPDMYAQVYAESKQPFSGGFVGERPGVAAGALESAIASVRARLEAKAAESLAQTSDDSIRLSSLARIEYVSLPNTSDTSGGVRISQRARVSVPVFSSQVFASAISGAAVDASDIAAIRILPRNDFQITPAGTSTTPGDTQITFALQGAALLVWDVDEQALQEALAGKEKVAFEAIVAGFPSIQGATARIEPFWRSTFPDVPADIEIRVTEPSAN